jgi:hypothetical protein
MPYLWAIEDQVLTTEVTNLGYFTIRWINSLNHPNSGITTRATLGNNRTRTCHKAGVQGYNSVNIGGTNTSNVTKWL